VTDADSGRSDARKAADPSLEARAARGGRWLLIGRAARAPVELISLMVLARVLAPADFGKVGMVTSFTAFAALFRDLGLSTVTIQRPDLDEDDKAVLFWSSLGVGALLTGATAAMAPAVAWFFEEPQLIPLTLALSLQFVFVALGAQHLALLRRELRLGLVATLQLGGALAGLAVAVTAGRSDWGAWALALSLLTSGLTISLLAWIALPWRPRLTFRRQRAGTLLQMGAHLTGFHFANYFSRNLDDIIIGRAAGPTALGLYQKAYDLLMLPLSEINAPAGTVAIPLLSRLLDEPERYRTAFRRVLQRVLTVTTPLGALLMSSSELVLEVFLGADWIAAAPIASAFGLLLFTQPIGNATGWLFISQGRTRQMFQWGLVGSSLSAASFFGGIPWGPEGVAISYAVSGVLVRLPAVGWWVTRSGPVSIRDLVGIVAPFAPAAVSSSFVLWGLRGLDMSPIAGVGAALPAAFAASALGLGLTASGRRVLRETVEVIRGQRPVGGASP
jgi:PST family polysaccharide transporter